MTQHVDLPHVIYVCSSRHEEDARLINTLIAHLGGLGPPDFVILHEGGALPGTNRPPPMALAECDLAIIVETVHMLPSTSRMNRSAARPGTSAYEQRREIQDAAARRLAIQRLIGRQEEQNVPVGPPAFLLIRAGDYDWECSILAKYPAVGARALPVTLSEFGQVCAEAARYIVQNEARLSRRAATEEYTIQEYVLACLHEHLDMMERRDPKVQVQVDELSRRRRMSVYSVPGQLVSGRYRLVYSLSTSELSNTWVAWDAVEMQAVIVHIFGPGVIAMQQAFEELSQRIGKLAEIQEPGICGVVETLRREVGRWLYVTKSPDGEPFRDLVRERRLRGDQIIAALLRIGAALQLAHERGVVHGSLDPASVIVGEDGEPCLVRFDMLAWLRARPRRNGSAFVAPELSAPGAPEPTVASDVYSFGALAVFAFFGAELVPNGASGLEALIQDLELPNEEVKRALIKATSADPAERHPSVAALCEALSQPLRGDVMVKSLALQPIPGARFRMGREPGELENDECKAQETPARNVRVSSFQMTRHPVTRPLYRRIMGYDPSPLTYPEAAPVTNVSFLDALRFCNRLSQLAGLEAAYRISPSDVEWRRAASGFRLPTEAEWELAARGADGRKYPWGSTWEPLATTWNGPGCLAGEGNQRNPGEVGQHPQARSPFGIEDMVGLVWEWCWDRHAPYSIEEHTLDDPPGPGECVPPREKKAGERYRSLRGGCFRDQRPLWLTCTVRIVELETERHDDIGFRVVRSDPTAHEASAEGDGD